MQNYHLHSLSESDVTFLNIQIKDLIQLELSFDEHIIENLMFPDLGHAHNIQISPAHKWVTQVSNIELLENNLFLSIKQTLSLRGSFVSSLFNIDNYVFNKDDYRTFSTFGKFIVSRLLDLSEALSRTQFQFDPLTGAINRRAFESILFKELSEIRRRIKKSSLVFIDIDNFKHINDTFGHDSGDIVLSKLTEIISLELRSYDVVSRWGGEEFVLLITESNIQNSVFVCERVRVIMNNYKFKFNDTELSITCSMGITNILPSDTVHTVVNRADKMMYLSKANGKDRITSDIS
jgi:diguanylate cyclase (GGDEF)-like protein